MKKTISLNRTVLNIILIGYAALLILLLCMDYYLIAEHQESNRTQEEAALESYMEKTANGMEKIRRFLYDIYLDDSNFAALSGNLSDVEKYDNMYELCKSVESQMLVDEELQGFYVFDAAGKVPMYKVDLDQIRPDHSSSIGTALQMSQSQASVSKWFSLTIDNCVYLAIGFNKGNATIYGIRSIGNLEQVIVEGLHKSTDVVLIVDGRAETYQDLAQKLDIIDWQSKSKDKFYYRKSNYSVYGARVNDMNLWICPVFERAFYDYVNMQQIVLIILTAVSMVAALILVQFVRKNMVKPLVQLRYEMEKIRNGTSKNIPEMTLRFSELKEVTVTLQDTIAQLEEQRLLVYHEFIEKQKAQLQYLQLQLKPHFYLNGLKTLNALALDYQTEKVQNLILNLSEHMRYLMQSEREFTTLSREIDFTKNYIELQDQTSGRKVEAKIEIDPEVNEWRVPILVVQTFVENSIKYAKLGSANNILKIRIRASLLDTEEGNYLDLQISDNGQGYTEEILEEIRGVPAVGEKHVGINNLKRRCQILYGEKAEFTFYNMQGAVSECILPEREK